MGMQIKNIDELNAQINPLQSLTLDKDISFEDALAGTKNLFETLKHAIAVYDQPEGQSFFESKKGKIDIERARVMLDFIQLQDQIIVSQLEYRKYKANGGEPIDFFEWD